MDTTALANHCRLINKRTGECVEIIQDLLMTERIIRLTSCRLSVPVKSEVFVPYGSEYWRRTSGTRRSDQVSGRNVQMRRNNVMKASWQSLAGNC